MDRPLVGALAAKSDPKFSNSVRGRPPDIIEDFADPDSGYGDALFTVLIFRKSFLDKPENKKIVEYLVSEIQHVLDKFYDINLTEIRASQSLRRFARIMVSIDDAFPAITNSIVSEDKEKHMVFVRMR